MPLSRLLMLGAPLVVVALILAQGVAGMRVSYLVGLTLAAAVFIVVFIKSEAGLYLVLLSMLLSPEFAMGPQRLAEGRAVVIRFEDLLLIAIALSWLAKTAVNKELGLVVKTPLNRWIVAYALTTLAATLLGYLTGTVKTAGGFFYVLKYVEYFVVYYLTVNHLHDRAQAWRLVATAFVTAGITSLMGLAQIPSGERVSAPFEGETGEPNTFGGYLMFMMAVAAGIGLETARVQTRAVMAGLVGLMTVPFLFTLSRASYLGAVVMLVTLAALSSKLRFMAGILAPLLVAVPLLSPALLPAPVTRRITGTFVPEVGQPTIRLGGTAFDPSTSERVLAAQQAFRAWTDRPLLGRGVTGFIFIDTQYFRTLVETGIVGLAAFLGLAAAIVKAGLGSRRRLEHGEDRGLALGFVAGTVGLLFHAFGANTFIIVRIMEPFWFFAGIVVALPTLAQAGARAAGRPAGAVRYAR
jgi:hypothetical protein